MRLFNAMDARDGGVHSERIWGVCTYRRWVGPVTRVSSGELRSEGGGWRGASYPSFLIRGYGDEFLFSRLVWRCGQHWLAEL